MNSSTISKSSTCSSNESPRLPTSSSTAFPLLSSSFLIRVLFFTLSSLALLFSTPSSRLTPSALFGSQFAFAFSSPSSYPSSSHSSSLSSLSPSSSLGTSTPFPLRHYPSSSSATSSSSSSKDDDKARRHLHHWDARHMPYVWSPIAQCLGANEMTNKPEAVQDLGHRSNSTTNNNNNNSNNIEKGNNRTDTPMTTARKRQLIMAAEVAALLKFKAAISNWPLVSSNLGIQGWDESALDPIMGPCNWTGIDCQPFPIVSDSLDSSSSIPSSPSSSSPFSSSASSFPPLSPSSFPTLLSNDSAWRVIGLALPCNSDSAFLPPPASPPNSSSSSSSSPSTSSLPIPSQTPTPPPPPITCLLADLSTALSELSCLRKLRKLDLYGNALYGTLPSHWATVDAFPDLEFLRLSFNDVSGPLPDTWGSKPGSWPNLKELFLNDNFLTGAIPNSWGNPGAFPKLELLFLSNNNLSGVLPLFYSLSSSFSSFLPSSFLPSSSPSSPSSSPSSPSSSPSSPSSSPSSPSSLSSSPQPLPPPPPSAFPSLMLLSLAGNRFTGALPSTWGSPAIFPLLEDLILMNNALDGSLPVAWAQSGRWTHLQGLLLAGNQISGSLPPEWGSTPGAFPALGDLYLYRNNLTGTLPREWAHPLAWPQLRWLSLFHNQLTGTLPAEWGGVAKGGMNQTFPELRNLFLSENEIQGTFPAAWIAKDAKGMPEIRILDLSKNKLEGALPEALGEWGGKMEDGEEEEEERKEKEKEKEKEKGRRVMEKGDLSSRSEASSNRGLKRAVRRGRKPNQWRATTAANSLFPFDQSHGSSAVKRGTNAATDKAGEEENVMMRMMKRYRSTTHHVTRLRRLNTFVDQNQTRGTLNLGPMPKLERLRLENNRLEGSLPASWGAPGFLPSLQSLSLHGNSFSGSIPTLWSNRVCSGLWSTILLEADVAVGEGARRSGSENPTKGEVEEGQEEGGEGGGDGNATDDENNQEENNLLAQQRNPSSSASPFASLTASSVSPPLPPIQFQRLVITLKPGNDALCGDAPPGFNMLAVMDPDVYDKNEARKTLLLSAPFPALINGGATYKSSQDYASSLDYYLSLLSRDAAWLRGGMNDSRSNLSPSQIQNTKISHSHKESKSSDQNSSLQSFLASLPPYYTLESFKPLLLAPINKFTFGAPQLDPFPLRNVNASLYDSATNLNLAYLYGSCSSSYFSTVSRWTKGNGSDSSSNNKMSNNTYNTNNNNAKSASTTSGKVANHGVSSPHTQKLHNYSAFLDPESLQQISRSLEDLTNDLRSDLGWPPFGSSLTAFGSC